MGRGVVRVRSAFLDVQEVADMLCLPVNTVYDYAKRGIGPPSFKIGRHRRWDRDQVHAWVEEKRSAAR